MTDTRRPGERVSTKWLTVNVQGTGKVNSDVICYIVIAIRLSCHGQLAYICLSRGLCVYLRSAYVLPFMCACAHLHLVICMETFAWRE